mmetsp:Transcript_25005/g.27818  ORF Transcript_25005/g.27818 Transcript_25005/m.27818 type:complete len:441 (+) Transcript_25005:53-1375(+)
MRLGTITTIAFCVIISMYCSTALCALTCGGVEAPSINYPFSGVGEWTSVKGSLTFNHTATDLTGKILIIERGNENTIEALVRPYHQIPGLLALIISDDSYGQGYMTTDGSSNDDLTVPTVEVDPEDVEWIKVAMANKTCENATVYPEENPFVKMYASKMFALSVHGVMGLWASLNIIYALYKLFLGYKSPTKNFSVPMIVLTLEVLNNITRVILYGVDPWDSKRIYPASVSQFLIFLANTFALSALMLVTMYWHKLLKNSKVNVNMFLSRYKGTMAILFGVFLFLMLAATLGAFVSAFPNSISYIVLSIILVAVCVFFAITAVRVTYRTRRLARTANVKHLRIIMYKSLAMAMLLFFYTIVTFGYIFIGNTARRSPVGRVIVLCLTMYAFLLISTLHISTLFSKKSSNKTNRTSGNVNSKTSTVTSHTHNQSLETTNQNV